MLTGECWWLRRQRIQDLKRAAAVKRFGSVLEIGSADFVREVTHAGEGVWAIVLLYKDGCGLAPAFAPNPWRHVPSPKL